MVLQQSLSVFRRSSRIRQLALASAALGSFYIGARFLARQLLLAMLYHPFRYEDDPQHEELRAHYANAFGLRGFKLREIGYALPTHSLQGGEQVGAHKALLIQPAAGVQPFAGMWVVFGGNAMVGTDWLQFCYNILSELPQDSEQPAFLLVDYPGYGANAGAPTPQAVLVASVAAVRSSLEHFAAPPEQLHILGHSLGAAAAAHLAVACVDAAELRAGASSIEKEPGPLHPLQPGRLLLSAPFTNIETMAQIIFRQIIGIRRVPPAWILRHFVTHRWDNMVWVPKAASAGWDVSIVLGSRDEIVPPQMGKALKDAMEDAGHPCTLVEVKGAGHNNLIMAAYRMYSKLMGLPSRSGGSAL